MQFPQGKDMSIVQGQGAASLTCANIPGAIRLPMASAQQTDLEGRAVAYWSSLVTESLEEATDAGRASFDRRLFFYTLITESLDYFQEAVDEQLEDGVTSGGASIRRV